MAVLERTDEGLTEAVFSKGREARGLLLDVRSSYPDVQVGMLVDDGGARWCVSAKYEPKDSAVHAFMLGWIKGRARRS